MGTNYYATIRRDICGHCGRADEKTLHIGKSSGGWCFALHVIPEENLNSLNDWKNLLSSQEVEVAIRDEYGAFHTLEDLLNKITNRVWQHDWESHNWSGYSGEAEFHARNYSQRGPNNLLRHEITKETRPTSCIGHGEGTWDYLTGEFS